MAKEYLGNVTKAIHDYTSVICKDEELKQYRGKKVAFIITSVEEIKETTNETIIEKKGNKIKETTKWY